MIIKTRGQAASLARSLNMRLAANPNMYKPEREEIEKDIQDLNKYSQDGTIPDDPWNNVRLWLCGNSLTTLP